MGKKSRKKKSRRKSRRGPSFGEGRPSLKYTLLAPPLEGMTESQVTELFRKQGAEYERKFQDSFASLQETILTVDPVLLLAALGAYGPTWKGGEDPELAERDPTLQHHVELVQALALRHPVEAFAPAPAVGPVLQVVSDLARDAASAFLMRRAARLDPDVRGPGRFRPPLQEHVRAYTQAVRNWGYPEQMVRITRELLGPLDTDVEVGTGVRISHLVDMLDRAVDRIETRLNDHWRLVGRAVGCRDVKTAVREYYRAFPDLKGTPGDLLRFLEEEGATLEQARAFIIHDSDTRLPQVLTLTVDDLHAAYPGAAEPKALASIVDRWTLGFGDLADEDPEHFFLANPVWARPLIRVARHAFFCPVPGLLVSFSLELLETVLKSCPGAWPRYEKRRSVYLEDRAERLFRSAFPRCRVYRGVQWHDPVQDKRFESDLLVLSGSHAILVEAKSGRLCESARRGLELRLESAVRRLRVEPARQAARFADHLKAACGVQRFSTSGGEEAEVDAAAVEDVIRLTITLDYFSLLAVPWSELRRAGFAPEDLEVAPTISLADLENVFDILDGEAQKVHYLARRQELEANAIYLGDELDLLEFYLDTGFNIGPSEFDGTLLQLSGLSKLLDPYLMRRPSAAQVGKPSLRLTKWWRDMVSRVETKRGARWTQLCYHLLNIPYDEQVTFECSFKRLRESVQRTWQSPGHKNVAVLVTGAPQRPTAIVGLAHKGVSRSTRNRWLHAAAERVMGTTSTGRVVAIGVDLDDPVYPYNVLALLVRGPDASGAGSVLRGPAHA